MSADNQEFSIPFEESRRGANSSPEQKAALGRLGRYLGSRAVNRPTIGERRRERGGRDFDLPTGGKPGTRNPTGSRRDVDGDGWADEGTSRPVWVGVEGQGGKPASPARRSARRERTPQLSSGADYMGQHQAPDRENGAPLHELTANGIYPDDIYASNALEMYGFGGDFSAEALSIASSAKGKPKKQIKIYRAVPLSTEDEIRGLEKQAAQILRRGRIPNSVTTPLDASGYYSFVLSEIERLKSLTPEEKIKINSGDWVTPVREYAVSHGRSHLNNKYKIISKTVPASHLFTDGNSIEEWGYDPGLPSRKKNEQGSIFTPSKEEQGDVSEALSSGKKYQEIVDSQEPLSEEKKEIISEFSDSLTDAEFQKADVYILDTRPQPPRPPGVPESKPRKILQDSEERTLEKERVRNLLADAFEGEMTFDEDIVLNSDDGQELNIGKRVLVEVTPHATFLYSPPIKINEVTDNDLKEQKDIGIYDELMQEGDLLTEITLNFRIKPLPEYNDKVLSLYSDEEVLKYVRRDDGMPPRPGQRDGTPAIATASRNFMRVTGEEKDVRFVSHDSFYVNRRAQGQGIGSEFNARNEQLYKELGLRSITTWGHSGAGSRGATHWPKNGFTWGGEQDKQKFIGIIDNAIVETPELFSDEDRKKISSMYSKDSEGFWQTEATAEELLDFPAAEKVFSDANGQIFYTRPLRELTGASSSRDSSGSLSSGRNVSELYDGEYGIWQEGEQLTPDSLSRLISMVFEENDVDASLPKYEGALEKLDDYKEFGYGVNDLLRSWDGQSYLTFDKPQNSELGQYQSMQRLLMDNKTTAGITLYRAITRRPEIENLQEGDVFGDRGFQSFSLMSPGQYTGQGSKRPIVLRLLTTKNTRGRYISRRPRDYDFSNTDKTRQEAYFGVNEHEMLLPAGATYKLVKKTETDDGKEIWDVKLSKQGVLSSGAKEVKLDNVDSETLSSGKAPRYPRTPTLGAFLGKADEDFADVDSWEEFKRLYDDKEVVFFDYETTGLVFGEFGEELAKGAPVQFGAVKIKNGKEVGRINLFMNPEEELGEWSRKNLKDADGNPLTDEWLGQQMSVAEAHRQLVEFAGPDALFGVQNATFDKAVLDGVLEQMGEEWRPSGYLDTREIAALTLPKWTPENEDGPFATDRDGNRKPSSSLAAITEYLGVDLGDGHHNADVDAFATSQVMQRMIDGAIEKGWSKDALSKEKRDSLYQETVDKFNADLEKFESDKDDFLSSQNDETAGRSSTSQQYDFFKKPLRPIRPRKDPIKKPSPETMSGRVASDDSLYDEAYGPIRTTRRTRTPQARGIGETEYDAILEMVDFDRRKKKLRKASFSYGPDEFEKTLQWTKDNTNREVDIKIMSEELEVPLSNAYFFIGEFSEIFERLESAGKGRQKYRIRTPQEIKDYLSSGRISDNEKTSYKIKNNARNYLLNQEERPIGLISEYRARYEYYDGYSGYGGRRLGSRDESGFNQEAFEQAGEDVFGKRFDTFEEMVKESNRLQDLFKEDENYREKIKQESIEKHGYAYSPIYKNGELTANVSIDVYDDELAYNSLYNLLLYMQRGRDGQTATRNTLKKLLKDIEESNKQKNKIFKTVYDENGSRYKLFTFDADLKKLESEELRRLTDKYKEEGMSLLDAINRAISDLKNDERFSDDKMYLDDGNQSLSSGRQRPLIPMRRAPERRPAEPGKRGVKGYGQADASGKEVRRSSTKWLAGMTSEEMSLALVPSSKEEHFEMWADDLAGTGWNKDRKYRKYLKQYYDQLDGHENALRIDYSPEGLEASRELVRSMLDSSPQMKWMFENFGAPLIGVFTRDAMNEYEGRPDVKERMELLRQQRGMEKTPFVSGLASREFGFVGLTPRALIDRESYDNVGAKYPLELDPNRKPGLREAHIDRSLHGTLIHEYGHWLHYRAIRDLETNSSGGSKTYYGSGKLDDPMYRAALDVAEEYANPDTDNEAIEIYSQFIDLTGRDAGEMFKAHPDKALLATSYGNVNKREAIAEAFVAIMHPNKDLAKNVLSPKLRRDIYALAGVDPDNIPWEARPDGRPSISMSLSSGAEAKPGREKRRGRISRALRQLVGADEESDEEVAANQEPYEFEAPERPEGLASFSPEPSESLRAALPIPSESDMTEELVNDVKQIPIDPILERLSSLQVSGFGVSMFSSEEERKSSSAAKRMISLNVSETANLDPREFVESFSDESIAAAGLDQTSQRRFFNAARNFKALKEIFDAIDALPEDASDEDKAKARRFAVDRTTGSLVSTENHDKIIQKRFYYDEMIDKLEERSYDELFGPEWEDLTRIALNDEKSVVSPYLLWAVGGDDAKREMISFGQQIRGMLGEFMKEIKRETGSKPRDPFTGRELGDDEGLALVFAPLGEIDPRTGKPGMAIVSTTGTATEAMANDMRLLVSGGKLVPENERTDEQHRAYDRLYVKGIKDDYLQKLAEAGMVVVDKTNVDSDETKELFRNFLINRLRFIAGNAESYKAQYEFTSGVSFFDIETPEGLREAKASIVSDIIHTWAISANNSNPVAMAIQHEARKMFGLDEAVGWYGRVRGPREGLRLDSAIPVEQRAELGDLAFDDTPELSPQQAEIIGSVVKGIYDATQHYYKSKGITHVAIWRGMKGTPEMTVPRGELAERRVSMRPLSSWTTNSNMAQMFSTTLASTKRPGIDSPEEEQAIYDENLLMKAYVPVEQIFSNPLTGFGCLGEDEVVLLGRPTDTIMITPPANFLPEAITDESVSDDVRKVTEDILSFATNRDKVTNAAYRQLTGLGYGDFNKRFGSKSSESLSSGALSPGTKLSSGKVIKYNFVEARMRASDIKVTFNRDPERVAAVKATLAKGFMGGFTVEVDRMDDIKEGIAIARNKHGMKVDAVADFDAEGNPSDELVDTFLAWMDFHGPKTFMEPKSGAEKTTIGGWVSEGTVYLDVVDVYPNTEENLTKAADMGLGEDQIAVTNLNKLWELLESGEDVSPAFIDSGGTGGFTLDEESVKRVSAALSDLNSNKFNTGSMQLKRIGNTKKFTKGPVSGARRVRNTDFATGEKRDYWIIAGANGMVKVFTHDQYLKVRDKKIQGLFDKMSTQSDILASMFEAKNIKPAASMSFVGGRNVGKPKVAKEHKNRGLTSGMANLYGFSNNLPKVGIQMGDKIVAAMI